MGKEKTEREREEKKLYNFLLWGDQLLSPSSVV